MEKKHYCEKVSLIKIIIMNLSRYSSQTVCELRTLALLQHYLINMEIPC